MMNLRNRLFLPSILSLLLVLISACQHTDLKEMAPVNSQLTGTWEVKSYQLAGEEQMGQNLLTFYIEFSPSEAASGDSNWAWTNPEGENSQTTSFYTISADGRTMLMSGKEYGIDLLENELTLHCDEVDGYCMISAQRY